jgi:hypothetical protein
MGLGVETARESCRLSAGGKVGSARTAGGFFDVLVGEPFFLAGRCTGSTTTGACGGVMTTERAQVGATIATVVSRAWANADEQAQASASASTGQIPGLLKPRVSTTFLVDPIEP